MARYTGGLGDARDHSVHVAPVNGVARKRTKDEGPAGPFSTAGFEDAQDRDGQRHGRWLVALADQMQDPVAAQGVGVVLDQDCGRLRGAHRVDT